MKIFLHCLVINMDYLLDTCTLLWAINDSDNLPKNIKAIIDDYDNDILVSQVSIWEIAIKHQKNPNLMPYNEKDILNVILRSGFILLDIRDENIISLPEIMKQNIHKDPFDYMLLATAMNENATLLSHDSILKSYTGIKVVTY